MIGSVVRPPGYLADAVLVLALAGIGALAGGSYYAAASAGSRADFYQVQFAPAVMAACGRGFVDPVPATAPAMTPFLGQQRTTFDCTEIPATVRVAPPTAFQTAFRYMMLVVAIYWRATGVSWDHLAPIFGALHGLVVGLAFLALRVVLVRWLAAPLSLAIACSPAQLSILPYLRDSAKTPFFVADVLLVLLVWTRPLTTRTLVVLSGLFGLVAGIGIGFRPDVVLWFPMLGVALLFGQHASLRRRLTATALGLAVSAGALGVFGWPILRQYTSARNFGHVALLGFAREFDDRLGVRGGPYTIAPLYNDEYMWATVNSYATRHGHQAALKIMTPEYETFALSYYWEVTRTFSADVATRLVASILHVLNLPFDRQEYASDSAIRRVPGLHGLVRARRLMLGGLDGGGPYIALVVLLMFAARRAALAWGFAITVLYLTGLPVLQFHHRHYSHLELIGLFALGILVQSLARLVPASGRAALRGAWTWPSLRPGVVRVGACLAAVVLIPLMAIHALRWRQQSVLTRLIASYNLAAEEMPYTIRQEDPNRVLVVPTGVPVADDVRRPGRRVFGDYLVVDVGHGCDAVSLTMRMKYDSNRGTDPFSRDVPVTLWPAREYAAVRLFLPVYQFVDGNNVPDLGFRFAGLELLAGDLPCLAGVKRIPDAAGPSLWLDLTLSHNWKDRPLYETLAGQAIVDVHETTVYRSSPGLPLAGRWVDTVTHVLPGLVSVSTIATVDPARGVIADGFAGTPFAYLVSGRPVTVVAGSQLVAVGELFSGGVTVGILKNDAWSQTVNVTTPGRFIAAVDASTDGAYVAVIANVNPNPIRPTRFVITGMDWAPSRGLPAPVR